MKEKGSSGGETALCTCLDSGPLAFLFWVQQSFLLSQITCFLDSGTNQSALGL